MASKPHIRTMVYCPVKKKMVDKGTEQRLAADGSPMIIPPLKPFISPITGEEITCREQLRRHNRAHGVTDSRDYSQDYYDRKNEENYRKSVGDTPEDRRDRIETIQRAMHRR